MASLSFPDLTSREREVLDYVARGLCNRQIAERLSISSKTVCNHMSHIVSKLEIPHRAQAIIIAREAGLGREPR